MCQGSCSTGDQNQMPVLHWAVPGPKVAAEALVFLCLPHGGGKHTPSRTHMQDVQLQLSETQKSNRTTFLGAQVLPRVKA